jgi:hypothetical protein
VAGGEAGRAADEHQPVHLREDENVVKGHEEVEYAGDGDGAGGDAERR